MIDTVRAGEEIPQTQEETRKRWDRYAKFAERTFNVEIPAIPYEQLEELDDEGQVKFVLDIVQQSGVQIPGGIVEHQRTSYLDNRALETVQIEPYDGHVTLYMADRYHDDVIEFEPRMRSASPTAAGASTWPTSRWSRSVASTSRPSTNRSSARSVPTSPRC